MYVYQTEIKDFSPSAIAGSGQCFRMKAISDSECRLIAHGKELFIREDGENAFSFSADEDEFNKIWKEYFDLNADYSVYERAVLPDDEFLQKSVGFGKGIRILNQDPFEMLISFIISQRKSVPAIQTSVERLCAKYGEYKYSAYMPDGSMKYEGMKDAGRKDAGPCKKDGSRSHESSRYSAEDSKERDAEERSPRAEKSSGFYTFPDPERLASADTDGLSECGLGYRVPYIMDAARAVCNGSIDLDAMGRLSTEELLNALMEIKGVGIKVASCVALFGFHRLDVVPVDVWMKRVIEKIYGGSLPEEYRAYAGIMQQYMFNYARIHKVGI